VVFTGGGALRLVAFDLRSGEELWRVRLARTHSVIEAYLRGNPDFPNAWRPPREAWRAFAQSDLTAPIEGRDVLVVEDIIDFLQLQDVRGEPIVNTPEEAYHCFMRTDMDALVVGPFLLRKPDQPALTLRSAAEQFGLD